MIGLLAFVISLAENKYQREQQAIQLGSHQLRIWNLRALRNKNVNG